MKHVTPTYAYWQIYEILNCEFFASKKDCFEFSAYCERNEILIFDFSAYWQINETLFWILCLLVEKANAIMNSLPTGREMKYCFELSAYW